MIPKADLQSRRRGVPEMSDTTNERRGKDSRLERVDSDAADGCVMKEGQGLGAAQITR